MAPVASALAVLLAAAAAVDAKPFLPGRHAPPALADLLSHSKRSFHAIHARYYGTAHGLTKPPPLPSKRDISLPDGWAYFGCITESWDERLLQGFSFSSESLTPLLCLTECQKLGYDIAGTEFGDECYCGNDYVGNGGAPNADSKCAKPCTGDSSALCGDAWLLSLYTYNMTGLPSCTSATSATATATLSSTASSSAASSAISSTSVSTNASLTYATLIASVQTSASVTTSVDASVTSSAVPTSTAPVYNNDNDQSTWYSLGCAIDSHDDRLLTGYASTHIDDLTVDNCLSSCESQGFAYAGVEYGEECYCGNSLPSSVTYSETVCSMPCKGDSSETCGGDWGLELYELISGSCDNSTTTGIPSATGTTVSSSSATTSVIPTSTVTSIAASSVVTASTTSVSSASSVTSVAASSASSVSTVAPASTSVPASSSTHHVWAHHMVGNTYPYGVSDWLSDIEQAYAYGIDGFALNMGSDSWQSSRIADAYTAAAQSGTGFKLFLSLDMTVMGCSSSTDASTLVDLVATYASHSNQALQNGSVLVSTFAGSSCTFGTGSMSGWQSAVVDTLDSLGIDIFFVPSIFADPSTFKDISFMDGELNWNSAWPMGNYEISTSVDWHYINQMAGKEYMAAISPFFFTHFGANSWNKNWLYRSDNWLYATRWEQLIAMRGTVKSLEILTWNDYGESSYIGPIAGALPAGSEVWVDGFDHEAINVLTKYYATAFKTGSYPTITSDSIVMWQRPHSKDAIATGDSVGRPTGWDWTDDVLWAVVLTTGPATVTLTSGSNTETFSVEGGLTKLKIDSSAGKMSGSIVRDGTTVASYTSSGSVYTDSPTTYNFNYYLGGSS